MNPLQKVLTPWRKQEKALLGESRASQNDEVLDPRLVDVFCGQFGEKYRGQLTPDISMDQIDEWDSLSYVELLCAIEEAFDLTFTTDQAAQLFQLGHIQNIINRISQRKPQEDVENAMCLAQLIKHRPADDNVVVMSGSSTREGLLLPDECEAILRKTMTPQAKWYNISVSGLVLAETLQLLETIGPWQGILALGISPIIMMGCGNAEFQRSANLQRFPFAAPLMEGLLAEYGYKPEPGTGKKNTLDACVMDHLDGCDISQLSYTPYLYPTLAPWPSEKFDSLSDLLTYYNSAVLNHKESLLINTRLLETIIAWCRDNSVTLVLHELTLHRKTKMLLEELGGIIRTYDNFLPAFLEKHQLRYLDIPALAGVNDLDFRDPAHLYQSKERYTQTFITSVCNITQPVSIL